MNLDLPERETSSMLKRAFTACAIITLAFATAAAGAGLLLIDDVVNRVEAIGIATGNPSFEAPEVTRAQAGDAQTILILGSDRRYNDKALGIKPRSDTIMLVRLDPDDGAITIMSIPRDLKVAIPEVGVAKINYAYETGGARRTLQTVKEVLGDATGEPFHINHMMEINFGGFRRAVDRIGCVYLDIDRRYFNQSGVYAKIDIQPGYQKLCGQDALDYVRYRHTDTDFIRSARQQDFVKQARNQRAVTDFLTFQNRNEIIELFARYVRFDRSLLKRREILTLLRLVLYSNDKPTRQVRFRARIPDGPFDPTKPAFVEASEDEIARSVREFLSPAPAVRPRVKLPARKRSTGSSSAKRRSSVFDARDLPSGTEFVPEMADQYFSAAQAKTDFPIYLPEVRTDGDQYDGDAMRTYAIRDDEGKIHRAYRFTVERRNLGEYYGVQGTTWKTPPILKKPTAVRTVAGRKLFLYYDGRKLRLVAWRTPKAVYWVTNTLDSAIKSQRLIAVAASLSRK